MPIGNGNIEMGGNRNLIRVLVVVLVLAVPAMAVRILSSYYDKPYLLPLALTKEGLAASGEGKIGESYARIDVHVGWGRDWAGTMTQAKLRDRISTTLRHQTELYYFEFDEQPGEQINITFVVGPNSYGPFPPGQMIAGIKSALIALRMTNGPEE